MLHSKRNLAILSLAQGLSLTQAITLVALTGLVGVKLAPHPAWATLPMTIAVIGSAITTLPFSYGMSRWGRRLGFSIGAFSALLSFSLASYALYEKNFYLLCCASFLSGIYSASAQYYRFAAVEAVKSERKGTAIALVLAGGMLGGIVGPELGKHTKDLLEPRFLGSYLSLTFVAFAALLLFQGLKLPNDKIATTGETQAKKMDFTFFKNPLFFIAVLGGVSAYFVMNLLMAATPLAMQACGYSFDRVAFVLEVHVLAMFAPSFFTAWILTKIKPLTLMILGLAIDLVCVFTAVSGLSFVHFSVALILLGLGWNFLYVGGTQLLTESYAPNQKWLAQGLNDFGVTLALMVSSFTAGALVTGRGWHFLAQLAGAVATGLLLILLIYRFVQNKINTKQACCD